MFMSKQHVIYNNSEQYKLIYILMRPVHKAQTEFFDHQPILLLYLLYTPLSQNALAGDLFKITPTPF